MTDRFQGDPALTLGNDGSTLTFRGGQPIMDQGLENQVQISLFTADGWPGNFLLGPDNQIGSDFEATAQAAFTVASLARVEQSAKSALAAPIFGVIEALAVNPKSWRLDVGIIVGPPGDRDTILLTRNGQNWINQATNPASEIIG